MGKDADLIVTDGDVLHYQTFVQWAIVDGEVVYDKQEEKFFAHIRPRPESALAPVETLDAGEENAVDPADDAENDDGAAPKEADGEEPDKKGDGDGESDDG